MDIARSMFDVHEPRCRLDAATFATMGVGMGFAIACKLRRGRRTVLMHTNYVAQLKYTIRPNELSPLLATLPLVSGEAGEMYT